MGEFRVPGYDFPLSTINTATLEGVDNSIPADTEQLISPSIPGIEPFYPDPGEELILRGNAADATKSVIVRGLDADFLYKELFIPITETSSIGSGWSRINDIVNTGIGSIDNDIQITNGAQTEVYRTFQADTQRSQDGFYTLPAIGYNTVVSIYGGMLRDGGGSNVSAVLRLKGKPATWDFFTTYFQFSVALAGSSDIQFDNPLRTPIDGPFDLIVTGQPTAANVELAVRISMLKEL